jgi:hypothetical protein
VLEYFDPTTQQFIVLVGLPKQINTTLHTITFVLNNSTFPKLKNLTGSVFTITVPAAPPGTPVTTAATPDVSLALPRSSEDLGTDAPLSSTSRVTVSLTTTTATTTSTATGPASGGGDESPDEEALRKRMQQFLDTLFGFAERTVEERGRIGPAGPTEPSNRPVAPPPDRGPADVDPPQTLPEPEPEAQEAIEAAAPVRLDVLDVVFGNVDGLRLEPSGRTHEKGMSPLAWAMLPGLLFAEHGAREASRSGRKRDQRKRLASGGR